MDERGRALREEIDQYIQQSDDYNQSFGVEMGHRYELSLAVLNGQVDVEKAAPQFDSRNYVHPNYLSWFAGTARGFVGWQRHFRWIRERLHHGCVSAERSSSSRRPMSGAHRTGQF
ncbi:monooxygenase [Penicillium vulpinum]|uniref:Uncharacterized protein n=1 Tax=Penicillium vulpinum TaxID=29845 RepID=A0A1V6RJT4_9EURO|nr:monooxygenase [Penicillium vulpinum]KAJ5960987.1 monooxygenase [Penicillium vulpinum]OQE01689.1 hypothetical protein PENVUL_c041G07421 [Penicillium vulpinum]